MFKIEKSGGSNSPFKATMYGRQGTGKTFTALWLAEDLAKRRNGKALLIDTEHGSDKYALAVPRQIHPEAFAFDVVHTRSLVELLDGLKKLDSSYTCVVIDSVTHLWEAAQEAWQSRNPGREPQLRDWGAIKRPYKALMRWVTGTSCDVLLCGREKTLFEDDDGRLKNVGFAIKAEGETAYETDVVVRMVHERSADGSMIPTALIEKDRWGILSGRRYSRPTPEMIRPVYPFLGTVAPPQEDDEERAAIDSTALDESEEKAAAKVAKSGQIMADLQAKLSAAADPASLGSVAGEIKKLKRNLTEEHTAALRVLYEAKRASIAGVAMPEV